MVKLSSRHITETGMPNYVPGSEEMGKLFTIIIIAEGYKEEVDYLKHIKRLYKEKSSKNVILELLNEEYIKEKEAVSESHPKKRLEVMLERIYDPSFKKFPTDERWLVCDRDDGSFTAEQYDDVCDECRKNDIRLVVSNPAFQLWLLFHFIDSLDGLGLGSCKKSSSKLKKIEKELKKNISDYEHGKLNMYYFEEYIDDAVKNSERYSLSIDQLKTDVGTNFGQLITSLKETFEI